MVSIHAPRVGRDFNHDERVYYRASFNSRAPRGARLRALPSCHRPACFNSRAPRGARRFRPTPRAPHDVSIHAPRVGRDRPAYTRQYHDAVSIHAPRVGRDKAASVKDSLSTFQFTRPAWGATRHFAAIPSDSIVSIHAPRVGRDPFASAKLFRHFSFNSRAPRGARLA